MREPGGANQDGMFTPTTLREGVQLRSLGLESRSLRVE